jgi:predicted nuclease with TOPRIM domain
MEKQKLISWIIVAIIGLLTIYIVFSGNQKLKEIKRLTKELQLQTDSLKSISKNYNRLSLKYDSIYTNLKQTRERFGKFCHTTDSISHTTISSVEKIRATLQLLRIEQEYYNKIDTTEVKPIFN